MKDLKTITEDKTKIEGVEFKAYCHIIRIDLTTGRKIIYCGIPVQECPSHRPQIETGGYDKYKYCPYCGLESCPKCRSANK